MDGEDPYEDPWGFATNHGVDNPEGRANWAVPGGAFWDGGAAERAVTREAGLETRVRELGAQKRAWRLLALTALRLARDLWSFCRRVGPWTSLRNPAETRLRAEAEWTETRRRRWHSIVAFKRDLDALQNDFSQRGLEEAVGPTEIVRRPAAGPPAGDSVSRAASGRVRDPAVGRNRIGGSSFSAGHGYMGPGARRRR